MVSALLAWLSVRTAGGAFLLRLEDLDRARCRPPYVDDLCLTLAWLGLDWDAREVQSTQTARYQQALLALAEQGRLYACACSRAALRAHGVRAADGGWAYPNTCRARVVGPREVATLGAPLRVRLPDGPIAPRDAGGLALTQTPSQAMGDPIVRRRDGSVAYQLAVVVDDAAWGVTQVVRGRDLAPSTATQVALQRLLGLPEPTYRHHLLLCTPHAGKLAKLHGAVGGARLRQAYSGPGLCGVLAYQLGLRPTPAPCTPAELAADFAWSKVRREDCVVTWVGEGLHFAEGSGG